MSSASTPAAPPAAAAAVAAVEMSALDDRDAEPRTPMKRLGSTRKLAAFNNIRLQLAEQARVLEARAEAAAGVAGELHDYCRRRADLEHEYSRALDKLARAAAQRHRDQRHKRGEWQLVGAYSCWQTALEQTRALARDHAALADLYGGRLAARTQRAADDVARLHRKCKDIVVERHEEVGGALVEAGAAGKARAAAAAEWRAAAAKLRNVYEQRERVAAAEPARHKKLKALDKELEKRRQRHSEARARALRARADYILCLEAANATLQRYYLDDVADIMLCMETGFSAVVGRCVQAAGAADEARAAALSAAARALCACARALDAPADRQRVLDAHPQTFAPPHAQLYQGTPPDEEDAAAAAALGDAAEGDEAAAGVGAELAARLVQLEAGARALRAECRERAKTLDAAERELVLQMEGSDDQWDISGMFGACSVGGGGASAGAPCGGDDPLLSPAPPPTPATPSDAPRKEQEDYYLAKFRSYVCAMGRLARMESRAATLRARLVPALAPARLPPPAPATPTPDDNTHSYRCVRGQWGGWGPGARGQFAAPLEEQTAGARRPLPRVLTECVRVIATYGLRHQGVFRVSGSQVEMQALRAAFERGGDPLCAVRDASDINSVCGLLKLYLRELRPPLLPPALLDRLLRLASLRDESEFVPRMRDLVATLPLCSMVVLRYLFAFLHHLSQYSEDNMMDAWNLAICLGPTLLAARGEGPAAAGGGQVHAQNQVNELVKRVIVHHRDIFPQHVAPHAAYRPETFATAAEGEGAGQEEQNGDAEGEGDGEGSCSGSECEVDAGSGGRGEHMDDLSLYDDDEEVSSDEGDSGSGSGGWGERGAGGEAESDRCVGDVERRAAQVSPVPAPAAPRAPAGAPTPAPPTRRLAEATPDLVLDLPARAPAPALDPAPPADQPTAADTFLHNRDTLKKRPAHNKQTSSGSEEEGVASAECGAAEGEGSPVPARNTARVAAKFAELTLTGGSLKPALAAKPALLRRPTPHPQHAAPHPAPPDH